jgi:hypothetical protein
VHVYKGSPLEGANMSQSGNEWLDRVECLGDDVVDFGTTARILVKPTLENNNLSNEAMANHLVRYWIHMPRREDRLWQGQKKQDVPQFVAVAAAAAVK